MRGWHVGESVVILLGLLSLAGCPRTGGVQERSAPTAGTEANLTVTSPAFAGGKPIPRKHAYKDEGENVSPPLAWRGAPAGTKSFALICDDPDAPSPKNPRPEPWVHWVLYDIPAARTAVKEGERAGVAGKTDFGEAAWGGPLPPPGSGTHRYVFEVYALDRMLGLAPGASKAELLRALEGHVLARGQLIGIYTR